MCSPWRPLRHTTLGFYNDFMRIFLGIHGPGQSCYCTSLVVFMFLKCETLNGRKCWNWPGEECVELPCPSSNFPAWAKNSSTGKVKIFLQYEWVCQCVTEISGDIAFLLQYPPSLSLFLTSSLPPSLPLSFSSSLPPYQYLPLSLELQR